MHTHTQVFLWPPLYFDLPSCYSLDSSLLPSSWTFNLTISLHCTDMCLVFSLALIFILHANRLIYICVHPRAHIDKLSLVLHFNIFQLGPPSSLTHTTFYSLKLPGWLVLSLKVDLDKKAEPKVKGLNVQLMYCWPELPQWFRKDEAREDVPVASFGGRCRLALEKAFWSQEGNVTFSFTPTQLLTFFITGVLFFTQNYFFLSLWESLCHGSLSSSDSLIIARERTSGNLSPKGEM